jgi:NAD-dependent dihydropyrimidine dehydrogenase PreA subunit
MSETSASGERLESIFIDVEIDPSLVENADLAQSLEDACPVDIYRNADGRVEVVRPNLDECVLCELCLDAAPDGKLAVKKLYDGTELRR